MTFENPPTFFYVAHPLDISSVCKVDLPSHKYGLMISVSYYTATWFFHELRCYHTVNFRQDNRNRHPITLHWGQNIGFVLGRYLICIIYMKRPRCLDHIHKSHNALVPKQCTIQNKSLDIAVPNGTLWDMGQVHYGIYEICIFNSAFYKHWMTFDKRGMADKLFGVNSFVIGHCIQTYQASLNRNTPCTYDKEYCYVTNMS